jgi:hypothetical protein
MIAQHAGVKLEDTGHICAHQHYMLSMLGRCRTGFLREAKRLQLSQQMTKRFVQALGKLFQSSPTLSRPKDEPNLTLLKSKNRNDLYKANKYLQQHLKKYLPQQLRDAQQVLVVLRSMPTSEIFQKIQRPIQQITEAFAAKLKEIGSK